MKDMKWNEKTVLVTGANGFLGKSVVKELSKEELKISSFFKNLFIFFISLTFFLNWKFLKIMFLENISLLNFF